MTNEEIVRAFIERGLNGHEATAARSFLTPDFVAHAGSQTTDLAGYIAIREDGWSWSDDWRIDIQDVIAAGDKVAVRATAGGTHTGVARTPLGHAPASHRRVHTSWIAIYRLVNGKIAESWTESDLMRVWHELGVL